MDREYLGNVTVHFQIGNLYSNLHDFSSDCPVKAGLRNASLKNHTILTNQRNGSKAKPPKKCVDGNQGKRTKQHKAKQQVIQINSWVNINNIIIMTFHTSLLECNRSLSKPLRTVSGLFYSVELPDKQCSLSTAINLTAE